eukprot:1008131_1
MKQNGIVDLISDYNDGLCLLSEINHSKKRHFFSSYFTIDSHQITKQLSKAQIMSLSKMLTGILLMSNAMASNDPCWDSDYFIANEAKCVENYINTECDYWDKNQDFFRKESELNTKQEEFRAIQNEIRELKRLLKPKRKEMQQARKEWKQSQREYKKIQNKWETMESNYNVDELVNMGLIVEFLSDPYKCY